MKRFAVMGLGRCSLETAAVVAAYPSPAGRAEASAFQVQGGGTVPIALLTASRLGQATVFAGKIGGDAAGEAIRQDLAAGGINLEGLITAPDKTSATAFVIVEREGGRRTVIWHRGTAYPLEVDELQGRLVKQAQILYLDGAHPAAAAEAARLARQARIPIMLAPEAWRPDLEPLLPLADFLIVDEAFAFSFLNTRDPVEALMELTTYGARLVCLAPGPEGALAVVNGVLFRQPLFRIQPVIDVSGRGAAFLGGLLHALLQRWPTRTCLGFATGVGGLACRALGGRAALPTLDEVMAVLPRRIFQEGMPLLP